MAQFIHLFDERNLGKIRRNGLKGQKHTFGNRRGVFCFPQTENFVVNHQWMRELRRFRGTNIMAVRFRIQDSEPVLLGRYNEKHLEVSASEAVGIAREHESPLGLEVVILRNIFSKELQSFYVPPKVTGWRYYPEAKGKKPCGCPYCQRGEPYSRAIKDAYNDT